MLVMGRKQIEEKDRYFPVACWDTNTGRFVLSTEIVPLCHINPGMPCETASHVCNVRYFKTLFLVTNSFSHVHFKHAVQISVLRDQHEEIGHIMYSWQSLQNKNYSPFV